MVLKDNEKNKAYGKYRARKRQNEEAEKEFNILNASYVSNDRKKLKRNKRNGKIQKWK